MTSVRFIEDLDDDETDEDDDFDDLDALDVPPDAHCGAGEHVPDEPPNRTLTKPNVEPFHWHRFGPFSHAVLLVP